LGPLSKQGTLLITVTKGARGKCLTCLTFNSPLYITWQWSYMRIWNRLKTFWFISYAYFLTWCAHVNTVMLSYLYIIEHIAFADKFITSKNTDFTRFFKIKRKHTGRLKTDLGGKKPSVGALVTCGKTPTTVTWTSRLEVNIWRFIAVLLLCNNDLEYNNPLTSFATCLGRQRGELSTCAKRVGGLAVTTLPQAVIRRGEAPLKLVFPPWKNVLV